MSIPKTCCVTGHRKIPPEQFGDIRNRLADEILSAINDGFTHFIMGGAEGVDLLFAELVVAYRNQGHTITLEACLPYANRLKSGNSNFQAIIRKCDTVMSVCDAYSCDCYFLRNREMVKKSSRVIAVYDGREKGGTYFTIRYARAFKRELRIIDL